MKQLLIFNCILIAVVAGVLVLLKKLCKTDRSKYIALLILPILTVLCHYSSLVYHDLMDHSALDFLRGNPNLILPIYPCNVVMWLALALGLLKNKKSKWAAFLIDYVFWFGLISALVGMFVNVDYFREPTLRNYDVTKGIVAHAMMLLNVLALPVLGLVQVKLERNLWHIFLSTVMMYAIGLYCNLVFTVIGSAELAYSVNSMFLLHSPFPEAPFLRYPLIALTAMVFYFLLLAACELFAYQKENRWYHRLQRHRK